MENKFIYLPWKINNINLKTIKMKKSIVLVAIVASVFTACKSEKKETMALNEETKMEVNNYVENNVDILTSVLTWKGSKPTGSHNGTVALKSGNLEVVKGKIKSGVFVVDLNTIKNLDLAGTDGAANLEGHLKGEDFFDVAKYPTSTFTISLLPGSVTLGQIITKNGIEPPELKSWLTP